jgi:hypothetical protein
MFSNIKQWFGQNRTGAGIIALALSLGLGAFMLSGCKMTDLISVDVPQQVQDATGADSRVTLTDAGLVMEDYVRYGERFSIEIDAGNERLAWFMSITDIGLRIGASQLPAGGLGLMLLSGVGGLFLKGPGTAREKEASYAKGKKDAEATLVPLLTAAGVIVPPKAGGDA